MPTSGTDLIRILLAVFLPSVAVLLEKGLGVTFLLNLVLTLLFCFPGMIHALDGIIKKDGIAT